MHASRLVSVLLLLQTRGRMTARELADELEVSLRTVYRDLDGLAEAGVPVYAERGPAGGYQLVDGYRTRLTGLSADEAETLFLSGLEGPAAQLGLGTVLAAAQLKVMAALPPELRGRASRIRERFVLVAPGWFRGDEDLSSLGTVAEGVWATRRLRIEYRTEQGPAERLVDPLGLVLKAGIWYLVARRDGLLRTYRISRIVRATLLDEAFERPADFDLGAHWEQAEVAFEESLRRVTIRLRVRDDSLGDLRYALGGVGQIEEAPADGHDGTLAALGAPRDGGRAGGSPDGWRELTIRTESLEGAHDDLLRLGARVQVLEPPELVAQLAATGRAIAATYAGAGRADVIGPHPGTDAGQG